MDVQCCVMNRDIMRCDACDAEVCILSVQVLAAFPDLSRELLLEELSTGRDGI